MTNPARGKAVGYAVVLFAAGAVCGGLVVHKMAPPPAPQSLKIGRTDEISAKLTDKLQTNLMLTPEQVQKITPFIAKTSQELETSHRTCLDQIEGSIQRLCQQVDQILTAEQKPRLKQLEAERAASMLQKYNYQPATAGGTNQ